MIVAPGFSFPSSRACSLLACPSSRCLKCVLRERKIEAPINSWDATNAAVLLFRDVFCGVWVWLFDALVLAPAVGQVQIQLARAFSPTTMNPRSEVQETAAVLADNFSHAH